MGGSKSCRAWISVSHNPHILRSSNPHILQMTVWQRRLRWIIGAFAIVFAVVVVFAFRRRPPAREGDTVQRTDPSAMVESTGGRIERFRLSHQDVSVEYERQLSYADGSAKLLGVKVVSTARSGGKTFTITGKEGRLGQNESTLLLDGDVQLTASDGFTVRTEHVTYADSDGIVRASGPVDFGRNRFRGSGIGMTYDKNLDAVSILDKAVMHTAPDDRGGGAFDVSSGTATFGRADHSVTFDRHMHVERGGEVIDADNGVARLTADDEHLDTIELHGSAHITGANAAPGALQTLDGDAMSLKYLPEGQLLQHASIFGHSSLRLVGEANGASRTIDAETIDIALSADGANPTALIAHQAVKLTFPAIKDAPSRTIQADDLDARGEEGRGLTRAHFAGAVDYREAPAAGTGRAAKSRTLDLILKPGMGEIEDATFAGAARFEEGSMVATAASARYAAAKGTLELSGTEAASRVPRVVNEHIRVDAARIDLTLAGPKLKASGSVQSELQPPNARSAKADAKLPSMLKQDQPVKATADALDYDGGASKATYTGGALLWQGDTSVKGASITLDDRSGDLSAGGPVTTTTMLEQVDKDKKTEKSRSIGTAGTFVYEEQLRRATYRDGAHLSGPQGDMTAERIELYLRPSGDELERAEAYDGKNAMTLREQSRTTTGSRMTYTAATDEYLVTGTPVKIVDECGRETTGRTLTFHRATDSIVVDGNGFRTQTKGGAACR